MLVVAGFATSTPNFWLLLNEPPTRIRRAPVKNTPDPSLLVEVTLVSVASGALSVAPFPKLPPGLTFCVKAVSLMAMDPLPVVAEKPELLELLPSKVLPFWTVIFPEVEFSNAVLVVLPFP